MKKGDKNIPEVGNLIKEGEMKGPVGIDPPAPPFGFAVQQG